MVREMLEQLIKIRDYDWGVYTFTKEPLKRKVSDEKRGKLIEGAIECGKQAAKVLIWEYGKLGSDEYAKKLGLNIIIEDSKDDGSYIIFAKFNEPNNITVYKQCIDKAQELVKSENLAGLIEGVRIDQVLIAHELYHYLEITSKDMYTASEKILLCSIGPFKNESGLVVLGEIGAMSFAKELLCLGYSPNIFDMLFLYPYSEEKAKALYNKVINAVL